MKLFRITVLTILFIFAGSNIYSQHRQQFFLTEKWKFYKGEAGIGEVSRLNCEDVTIPHTWNKEDGYSGSDYYRGTGIYTTKFNLPAAIAGNRTFLLFEGISSVAEIYVNDVFIGKHEGAFTAFSYEISGNSKLRRGSNTLTVKVSNAANQNIPPYSTENVLFGGIYRPVSIIIMDPLCISPSDLASPGVYIKQTNVSEKSADLTITTKIDNGYTENKNCSVTFTLYDKENKIVATSNENAESKYARITSVEQTLSVKNPNLWNGISNPYLYRAFIELKQGETVVDTLSQFIGLRYFSIDPKKGFMLNGKPYKLQGINQHQDKAGKGWAVSNADLDKDMSLIREMGANAIRLVDCPQSDYFYSLCDRAGIIVCADAPLSGTISDGSLFKVNAYQQLSEMIRQQYNHPSIFFRAILNESSQSHAQAVVAEVCKLAQKEDPTRIAFTASTPGIKNLLLDWNEMFDFAYAGKTGGINNNGLVTGDRETKKDAFYAYKVQWSGEPFIHIAGCDEESTKNGQTDNITVYSNCKKLKLTLNGIKQSNASGKNGVFTWKNIQLNPGENTISVSGKSKNNTVTDECKRILPSN